MGDWNPPLPTWLTTNPLGERQVIRVITTLYATAASGEELAVFDTALLGLLTVIGIWCLVRHPRTVLVLIVGLVAWFEAGPDAPLWPWLLATGWAVVSLLRGLWHLVWRGPVQ